MRNDGCANLPFLLLYRENLYETRCTYSIVRAATMKHAAVGEGEEGELRCVPAKTIKTDLRKYCYYYYYVIHSGRLLICVNMVLVSLSCDSSVILLLVARAPWIPQFIQHSSLFTTVGCEVERRATANQRDALDIIILQ